MDLIEPFGDFPPKFFRGFSEEKYARAFLDQGHLRFRPLSYFAALEDASRADPSEGKHRLATESGATLPELLILDSPMKNISERENREQFERFHRMLYELHTEEFPATQLVLIDKEYFPPEDNIGLEVHERHMQPNEPGESNPHPPLIPYYLGH
jgi:hypothetical protein